MTAIDRTAYPRPGTRLTREELTARYALAEAELAFIRANARGDAGRLMCSLAATCVRRIRRNIISISSSRQCMRA